MPQDWFEYEKMVENALRGVVRDALKRAAQEGLRGEHHFYIAFATGMPGVAIPDYLRAKYPQEMTIVLQHQFWDLEIDEAGFSVTLSFQKQFERLVVPFAAVRSFADPSVNFALEFAPPETPDAAARPVAVPAPLAAPAKGAEKNAAAGNAGAEVVTLDSFRNKR